MKPVRPKLLIKYPFSLGEENLPRGHCIFREGVPKQLKGKVDLDWNGHFEVSIKSHKTSNGHRTWSVMFVGPFPFDVDSVKLKVTNLTSKKAAIEAGRALVMAILAGYYRTY